MERSPQTLGELVERWRERSGLGRVGLAKLIERELPEGEKFDYQNIQNLEDPPAGKKVIKRPRYLHELAKVMGTSVADLIALRMPPPRGTPPQSSTDEPAQPQIRDARGSLSREEFLDRCANLSTPDWQLTARLMVAVGIVPGSVEGIWKNQMDLDSGASTPPLQPAMDEHIKDDAPPAAPRKRRT